MAAVQGGPNKLFAASVTYSPAPHGSYVDGPIDRLLVGQDSDWQTTALSEMAMSVRSPNQQADLNSVAWSGNAGEEKTATFDAGAPVGGDEFWIFLVMVTGGMYTPSAIEVEYSDDSAAWTTAKAWTGLTASTSASSTAGGVVVADISAAGAHRYWRVTFTIPLNGVFVGFCGAEIRDASTYNPLELAEITYSTAPSGWFDTPWSVRLLDGDTDYDAGRRIRLAWGEYANNETYAQLGYVAINTTAALTLVFDVGAGLTAGGDRFMLAGLSWTAAAPDRPDDASLEYSDNGTDWTLVDSWTGLTAVPTTGPRGWMLSVDISAEGDHRYWRVVLDHNDDWYMLQSAIILPTGGWQNAAVLGSSTFAAPTSPYIDFPYDVLNSGAGDWTNAALPIVNWNYRGRPDTFDFGYIAKSLAADATWPFTYDLGSAKTIDHVLFTGIRGNNNITRPEAVTLEFSDNGTDWTTAVTIGTLTNLDSSTRQWLAHMYTGEADPHRYWRLTPQQGGTAGEFLFISGVELWQAPAGGPIEVPVGQATEAETANPITPSISREVAVGQAVEAETAQPITPQISRQVPVGQATERELANSITPVIGRMIPVGQATEVETGQPITPLIRREVLVGQATEVELARFISPVKPIFVPVQTAVERELAHMIFPQQGQPFLPELTCEVIALGVTCQVSGLDVQSAILQLDIECEVT